VQRAAERVAGHPEGKAHPLNLGPSFPKYAGIVSQLPTAEILRLARKAVDACLARRTENVQAWADRLAADVANAND
jgi:hypothetical protein